VREGPGRGRGLFRPIAANDRLSVVAGVEQARAKVVALLPRIRARCLACAAGAGAHREAQHRQLGISTLCARSMDATANP
jgi:hypothetical protein